MTAFLARNKIDLATAAVVVPLASYGLHRMFPAPNVGFLIVASLMNIHASIAIKDLHSMSTSSKNLGSERTRKSTQSPESVSPITPFVFQHLCTILNVGSFTLLPIFARFVAQRMGIQVPDYIQTVGYLSLVGTTFWTTKSVVEILRDGYYQQATK
jgi:hypothetical protein